QCRFVPVFGQMPVNTIVTGVEFSADEPFPERRVAGIQGGVPGLVPGQHVRILFEALREFIGTESLVDGRIGQIGLTNKFGGGIVIFFFLPMARDLGLADISHFYGFSFCLWFFPLCLIWHKLLLCSHDLTLSSGCDYCSRRCVSSAYRRQEPEVPS